MSDADPLADLNQLVTSLSASLSEQKSELTRGLHTVGDAFEQAADRIAAMFSTAPQPAAPAAPAPSGAVTIAGPVTVMVANTPLAVTMAQAAPPSSGGVIEALKGVLGAIGGGIGTFVGSIGSGLAAPFLGAFNLVTLIAGVTSILDQVTTLLGRFDEFVHYFVDAVRGLVRLLFDELTAAGIFPVSRLFAGILFLIDRGVTLVLAHIQPVLDWLRLVMETAASWLDRFYLRATTWAGDWFVAAMQFTAQWMGWVIDTVVSPRLDRIINQAIKSATRAAVEVFAGVLMAASEIASAMFQHAMTYAAATIARMAFIATHPFSTPPPEPTMPDWDNIARLAAIRGRANAATLAEALIGPAPPDKPVIAPGTEPVFQAPETKPPRLRLPALPPPSPKLEVILAPQAPAAQAPAAPAAAPVTVTGGVTVQVTAQTVSMDNAAQTARVLAEHIADELARVTQADRFARGLATGPVV